MAWQNNWAVRWLSRSVYEPMVEVLQRGTEPRNLALSGALGITMGVFPMYGVTTLMCACAIAVLRSRCNAPTMMLANLVSTPLKLTLLFPFLRLGEFAVRGKHFPLSEDSFWEVLAGQASWEVVLGFYHAILGWTVAAPPMTAALYFLLLPLMRFAIHRYHSHMRGSAPADGLLTTSLLKDPPLSPTLLE